MSFNRKDLCQAVYKKLRRDYKPSQVSPYLVRLALEEMLDILVEALCKGQRVSISGFGRFEVRKRRVSGALSPSLGPSQEKKIILFKKSSRLKRF